MIAKFSKKYHDHIFFFFRVAVGLLFFIHGGIKVFGWQGADPVALIGLFGIGGLIELIVGLLLIVGLFVRLGALVGAVTMLVAYFYVHRAGGVNPFANGGELALLYFFVFLLLMIHGARRWGLEEKMFKKEMF
jgi:putative oxidoreductase